LGLNSLVNNEQFLKEKKIERMTIHESWIYWEGGGKNVSAPGGKILKTALLRDQEKQPNYPSITAIIITYQWVVGTYLPILAF